MTEQVQIRFTLTEDEMAEMALKYLQESTDYVIPDDADVSVEQTESGWIVDVSYENN